MKHEFEFVIFNLLMCENEFELNDTVYKFFNINFSEVLEYWNKFKNDYENPRISEQVLFIDKWIKEQI